MPVGEPVGAASIRRAEGEEGERGNEKGRQKGRRREGRRAREGEEGSRRRE